MLRNIIFTVVVLVSSIFNTTFAQPDDYSLVNQKPGWKIYKKGSGDTVIYVQEIDINKARISFIDKGSDSSGAFLKFPMSIMWLNSSSIAYSISNGGFFNKTSSSYDGISSPYKVSSKVKTYGWSTQQDINSLKMLVLSSSTSSGSYKYTAKVLNYSKSIFDQINNTDILTGLNIDFDKYKYSNLGRTFIGVKSDYSGNDYVYILNGKSLTQNEAKDELLNYYVNENNMIMLDGSGSTQLFFKNTTNTEYFYGCASKIPGICGEDKRQIPQAIAILPRWYFKKEKNKKSLENSRLFSLCFLKYVLIKFQSLFFILKFFLKIKFVINKALQHLQLSLLLLIKLKQL